MPRRSNTRHERHDDKYVQRHSEEREQLRRSECLPLAHIARTHTVALCSSGTSFPRSMPCTG